MRSCCAVYVDVGYLLAAAATRVAGSSLRRGIQADYASLIEWLVAHAEADSGLPLLRVNWYDAGGRPGGMPDASQDEIGQIPGVKLRLGRLSYSGEQKGVDVRIGLDLAIQARQRIADVVYLVSGDDDLTEAVEDAQSHGVQVVILAVPRHDERPLAVSKHLLREVDRTQVIDQAAIDHAFKPTAIPESLIPSLGVVDEHRDDEHPDGSDGSPEADRQTGSSNESPLTTGVLDDDPASPHPSSTRRPLPGPPRERRRTVRVHGVAGAEDVGGRAPTPADSAAPRSATEPAPVGVPGPGPARVDPGDVGEQAPAATPAPSAPSPAILARRKAVGVALPGAAAAIPSPSPDDPSMSLAVVDAVARQVVAAWCSSATPDALAELKAAAPVIPSELDRALLVDLSSRGDERDLDDATRHQIRARFWHHVGRVRPV
ncbi:NYN domain-containing protein [Mobilicoccus sp.]|uniref:NYN domain-containing protein n=1 Tax=Mobilicoccus sp. TaxID=2034349 RepID=UPI0028AAC12D|nr:NYN domain-containing protein [Mobilicoccus sp.]